MNMAKAFRLGKKVRYPITISKRLKQPGDAVQKGDPVLQYTFKWFQEVGDPFGEMWPESQTTIAEWDSPTDGNILNWKVEEGMLVDKDIICVEIEETCSHSVQWAGLCGNCGKDMNEKSWAAEGTDADRATVQMGHDQTLLSVTVDEASRAEEHLQRRLLQHRRLSLVVDLDQTIIHACIEPTVGEWQRDPKSPNYEAVKDVKAFQLNDDGPRGLTSGCWYYIKMRPGLKDFLAHIAEFYELHVYTMGTRAYAQNIAKIVDPDQKLFGERIISRDENGSLMVKSLSRLFPVSTKMVVVIDDRADVWPKNRSNLIKVVPYDFFVGIGDINSSFLPKRQDIAPNATPAIKLKLPDKAADKGKEEAAVDGAVGAFGYEISNEDETETAEEKKEGEATLADGENPSRTAEEQAAIAAGDDPALLRIQAEEQEEFLEKQLKERPLLHMQQELEKEDSESSITQGGTNSATEGDEPVKNGEEHETEHPQQHRHHLLQDDDKELVYLEDHLKRLHKAFYEEYDRSLAGVLGGRVAHLRPGQTKKVALGESAADLKIVPDIGEVMPRLKAKTLEGVVIVLSGLVPLGVDVMKSEIVQQAMSFGAEIQTKVSQKVTHVVVPLSRTRTQKVRQAAKFPRIKIVNQGWLSNCMSKWEREDETPFLVPILREDRALDSTPHSVNTTDEESGDDNSTDGERDEDDMASNYDDLDPDGVVPEALDDPKSPIDGLKRFDWGSADAELEEFMASGSEDDGDGNESDAGSVVSRSSTRSHHSTTSATASATASPSRSRKHPRDNTDDEDTDEEESKLAKKQRLARVRTTGLKTVKTPNSLSAKSESSLPTPEITGEEDGGFEGGEGRGGANSGIGGNGGLEGEGEGDGGDEEGREDEDADEDDLEAEMMAEFERGSWDEEEGDDDDDEAHSVDDGGGG